MERLALKDPMFRKSHSSNKQVWETLELKGRMVWYVFRSVFNFLFPELQLSILIHGWFIFYLNHNSVEDSFVPRYLHLCSVEYTLFNFSVLKGWYSFKFSYKKQNSWYSVANKLIVIGFLDYSEYSNGYVSGLRSCVGSLNFFNFFSMQGYQFILFLPFSFNM